ncbi:MAG: ferritin family protein [Candidatus Omnitrophota bacterium]
MHKFFEASEILEFALRIEENGEEFYRAIAKKMEKKEVKSLFEYLADEEIKHHQIFTDILAKVGKYEPPESYPHEYLLYLRSYADERIFNADKKSKLAAKEIKEPKEAAEFGMGMELDSVLYYLEAKNFVSEAQRWIIDKIIEEERGHYMKLMEFKKAL